VLHKLRSIEGFPSICNAPLSHLGMDDLDEKHPAILFHEYWMRLGNGQVPEKVKFRPADVPSILKWLMIFRAEPTDAGYSYFVHLQGTSARDMTSGLLEGKFLEEFTFGDCLTSRQTAMDSILEHGTPGFGRVELNEGSEFSSNVTVGMFPLITEIGEHFIFSVVAPETLSLRALF